MAKKKGLVYNSFFIKKDSRRDKEENIDKVIPDLYQQEFTKDQLLDKQKFEMSFDSFDKILKYINSSFEERRVGLNIESSEIVLCYYLFTNLKFL